MKSISEEVVKLTNESLVTLNRKPLDDEKQQQLRDIIIGLSAKNLHENVVYKLLCEYIYSTF